MSNDDLASIWREIIVGNESWVLFEHGTCVLLLHSGNNLRDLAMAVLQEWGPVHVGTPSADFDVVKLANYEGWVVTCHHPDILTYIAPDEVLDEPGSAPPDDLIIGLLGRSKRDQDAAELNVVHIERVINLKDNKQC